MRTHFYGSNRPVVRFQKRSIARGVPRRLTPAFRASESAASPTPPPSSKSLWKALAVFTLLFWIGDLILRLSVYRFFSGKFDQIKESILPLVAAAENINVEHIHSQIRQQEFELLQLRALEKSASLNPELADDFLKTRLYLATQSLFLQRTYGEILPSEINLARLQTEAAIPELQSFAPVIEQSNPAAAMVVVEYKSVVVVGTQSGQQIAVVAPRRYYTGSAGIIRPDGLLVTNRHVIQPPEMNSNAFEISNIFIFFPGDAVSCGCGDFKMENAPSLVNKKLEFIGFAKIDAAEKGMPARCDLAFLKIKLEPEKKITALELAANDELTLGQWLVVQSCPGGEKHFQVKRAASEEGHGLERKMTLSPVLVAVKKTDPASGMTDLHGILKPGSSGGLAINAAGKVVGVVCQTDLDHVESKMIPTQEILRQMKLLGLE